MKPSRGPLRWPAVAERLAETVGLARLHPAVVRWAASRPGAEPWTVAFSGGADSLALLLLLYGLYPRRRSRLFAVHFNHRLRGRASQADAAFCQKVCRALRVPCAVGRWERAAIARRGATAEASARVARFQFFVQALARRRSRVLWLGHQQDDVAETMLMRLARGSGSAGLAAPRPIQQMPARRVHLRPLLGLKKTEVKAALRAAGAAWREDASNAEDAFFRNRVRRAVIPAWQRAAGRDAPAGAALSRELLEEDDTALEQWVDQVALPSRRTLRLDPVRACPRAVVRRALHRWLIRVGRNGILSRQGFEALLGSVVAGRPIRHSLGSEGFAVIAQGVLRYQRRPLRRRN